jgi:hypothetical protein
MKIDIEGSEIYAFEHAQLLFATVDIRVIFMEWVFMTLRHSKDEEMGAMWIIEFLSERNYTPTQNKILLNKSDWKKWPIDIVWIKDYGK